MQLTRIERFHRHAIRSACIENQFALVADNLLDRILRETAAAKGRALAVRAAPAVAADLGGPKGEILTTLAREQGCRVELVADPALALEEFEVTTVR